MTSAFENRAMHTARVRGVVHDHDFGHYIISMMLDAISVSGADRSLTQASTTARGIPYTTHDDSASVRICPPVALMYADPITPSSPIPVITTPSTRAP